MDFSSPWAADIERALDETRPGRWFRLSDGEFARGERVQALAGWGVRIPNTATLVPQVDRFLLFMDGAFPYSELRLAVPGMRDVEWPHVESGQFLCLPPTTPKATVAARVQTALLDAQALLNWDVEKRRAEFGREIQANWSRHCAADAPTLFALADPAGASRESFCCAYRGSFLVADDVSEAKRWLKNDARGVEDAKFRKTVVLRLPAPLLPSEFPRDGAALLALAGDSLLTPFLALNRPLPVLLAFEAESGRGFVGCIIQSPKRHQAINGFRPGKEPAKQSVSFRVTPTKLCKVERVDRSWVVGRDHGTEVACLKGKRVTIVGCGALGSSIAIALGQAGVTDFLFVDGDVMHSHNPTRHWLGAQYIHWPKATAMSDAIRRHIPSVTWSFAMPSRFESASAATHALIEKSALIVTAGVDRRGEVYIDRWRSARQATPPLLCCFSEEFGLVGHAIAILGKDLLATRYDEQGNFNFLATSWPPGVGLIREAGCGNDFQPFGAVDLMPTVQVASALALDVLLGKVKASTRRTWFGARERVAELGGSATGMFSGNLGIHEYPWTAGGP